MPIISTGRGRQLFGSDPQAYHEARPDYPDALYELLVPAPEGAVLEVGAGSGIVTKRLLEILEGHLLVLEPDRRFRPMLEHLSAAHPGRLTVLEEPFETADLPLESFGLVVVATAYHWLDPDARAERLRVLLRPGGRVALFWNLFGDPSLADPFHDATHALLDGLSSSPGGKPDEVPFALRRSERQTELAAAGFTELDYRELHWPLSLNPAEVRRLYATFPSVSTLAPNHRHAVLDELARIAAESFGGRVTRNMTSVGYLFEKRH